MVIGGIIGGIVGEPAASIKPIGDIFINLLLMAAIPLVFFNLLAGLTSMSDVRSFGKTGIKVSFYYLITTSIAITVGILIMSMVKAGNGFDLTSEVPENIGVAPNLLDIIMSLFPSNIFESFAQGNLIHIVIFGLMIGITTLTLPKPKKEKLEELFQLFAELMRKLVDLIMYLAPLCLGALAAATIGEYGSKIMGPLLKFIGGVYTAQILMIFFYMLLLYFIGKVSPLWFLKKTSTLYYTTIATCSSLASLAVSLKIAETKLQLPKKIYGFTLPLGAQFNKDGTAIMLSAVLIFTAQAVGWQLTLFDIIQVIIVGLIVVEGSGGIPGGGLVVAMIFAKAFNLPLEVVAVVGGIYRLIDMGNTTVNCMGDLVGTVLISKQESKWLPESK